MWTELQFTGVRSAARWITPNAAKDDLICGHVVAFHSFSIRTDHDGVELPPQAVGQCQLAAGLPLVLSIESILPFTSNDWIEVLIASSHGIRKPQ